MFFRPLFLLVFFVCSQNLFAQKLPLTKNKLIELFQSSIRQESKTKIQTNSNPWVVCNDKNRYFSSDTISISNNRNYFLKCCNYIDWTFYKKDAFVLTKTQLCKEPTTTSATNTEDWFSIQIESSKDDLFIKIINQGKVIDKFKVISYKKVNNLVEDASQSEVLTLARISH